jgi:hypothetical protein
MKVDATCRMADGTKMACVVDGFVPGASSGLVMFLFAIFCAYWAMTTNRSAWLWFFLGLFFAPITGLVLLLKQAGERNARGAA